MKKVKRDKSTSKRIKALGDLGEDFSKPLLESNGFTNVINLNRDKKNFPFGDILAEKDDVRYMISVKARNKYTRLGKLNSRYKLGKNCYEHAERESKKYNAIPYWMAIQFDTIVFSAYLGSLMQLNGNKAILLNKKHLSNYVCLADNREHNLDFSQYKNTYEEL